MKEKKTILILILVLTIGIIGLTVAYFSNSTTLNNIFETKPYGDVFTEEFVAPTNWLPGDTTDKIVTVTNSGQVDEAVRISLSETWTPNNSNATLNGWIHADGTKSNHTTESELATDEKVAIINFDNLSDWTKEGDYYYYNYKLAPGETTDSLIESVTFNALTKLGDTCIPSTNNGTTTITCNSSGTDYDNATYKLTINIETVQYDKYASAWGTSVAIANTSKIVPLTVQQFVLDNTNVLGTEYNSDTKGQMFTLSHMLSENALNESRYIGDDPYNYVYFNCDDLNNQNSETCEVWRIIGVFDVEDEDGHIEKRFKLIRSSIPTTFAWDINKLNNWKNSSLQKFLNNDYYNRTGDAAAYGLKDSAKELIGNAKYYLGGRCWDKKTHYGSTEQAYNWERGLAVYSGNPSYWIGMVGLMYPSDQYLVYANGVNDSCYNDPSQCGRINAQTGWIFNSTSVYGGDTQWLISVDSCNNSGAFYSDNYGNLVRSLSAINSTYRIRPVVYLKSSIKITDGTGESTNPYKLSGN